MKNGLIEVGDIVQYSPRIGGEFEERIYRVRAVGRIGSGQVVAWLEGKAGCVHLDAIRLYEEEVKR